MGSSSAVLVPLHSAEGNSSGINSVGGGGAAVIIPELSVAISIGSDISSELTMTQLPFQDIVSSSSKRNSSSKEGFMSQLFKANAANDDKLDPALFRFAHAQAGSSCIAMWYYGRNEVYFFDSAANTMVSANASFPVATIRFARCSSGPSGGGDSTQWIARSSSSTPGHEGTHLIRVRPEQPTPVVAWGLSGDYCSSSSSSNGSGSVLSDKGETLWGGSAEVFAERLLPAPAMDAAGQRQGEERDARGLDVDVWSRCSRSRVYTTYFVFTINELFSLSL